MTYDRNADWLRTMTFDYPDVKTAEEFEARLRSIDSSAEQFLASPAGEVDHPVVNELRQIVYERNGGTGPLPTRR